MHHDIGHAGGLVWDYLDRRGESSALQIRSDLRLPQTLFFMALGWLSREGKVDILYRDRIPWVVKK